MIYFFLDIAYYPQLRRIDAPFMEELVSLIDKTLQDANAVCLSRHVPLLYSFDDSIAGIHLQAAQAAFGIAQTLEQSQERLTGFTIALDGYASMGQEDIIHSFKAMSLRDGKGSRLLLGKELRGDFSEFFSIEEDDDLAWASDFRFIHPVSADLDQSF